MDSKVYKLFLRGKVPSKKNDYKRRRGGGMYIPIEVKTLIDSLTLQAKTQWHDKPLERADVRMSFTFLALRSDLDNAYTCLQDILVKAGVLKNDNLKHIPSFGADSQISNDETVIITLTDLS